jgi:putative chitinase
MISHDTLTAIVPGAGPWAHAISAAAARFDISTPARLAAFIAQTAHESGHFKRLVENLNYSADGLRKTWPSRFDEATATAYARHPERIANKVYAGRLGNGDEASGDGWRFRGRGLIQVTGRDNYARCGGALGLPLTVRPQLLEEKEAAALSAAWFWKSNGCNEIADGGDFTALTRRINGGTHGLQDRVRIWSRAKTVLGI